MKTVASTEKYASEQEREGKLFNDIYDVVENTMQNIENGTFSGGEDNSKPIELPELVLFIDDIMSKSFKINVTNNYPKHTQYTYYLNGKIIKEKTNEKTCYIENLENDTEYQVKVIANIEDTKRKSSVLVITKINLEKEALLLFNNGEQYTDVIGGWHGGYSAGTNPENGSIDISKLLTINTWGIWTAYTIQTRNSINMSNYSQLIFEVETDTTLDTTYYEEAAFGITTSSSLASIETVTTCNRYIPGTVLSKVIYDISNFNENYYVWFYACNGRTIRVSKIYLVK